MKKEKLSLEKWIKDADARNITLAEFCLEESAKELNTANIAVMAKMKEVLEVMHASIETGLSGVKSHSGLTGGDSKILAEYKGNALLGKICYDAMTYAIAVGEANASMGRIVAAPTAGASGVLPGVLFALKKHHEFSDIDLESGLVVAGSIGKVIGNRASLAGATGGCQAECGSAAAMAAGAVVSMMGGTNKQVGTAVAIVFKNILGLVCDPVAGLVEVPCIKRNGSCAVQALVAAQMALAGVESFIPADEAIDAMKRVGDQLPCALRETAGGGMATSPTALEWAEKYFGK